MLGTLREQGTREPLAGIKIAVELKTAASAETPPGTSPQAAVTVESDADGHFSVPTLTAGTYQLKLTGPRIVTTVLTEQLSASGFDVRDTDDVDALADALADAQSFFSF